MSEETNEKEVRQEATEYKPTPMRLALHEVLMDPASRFLSVTDVCRNAGVSRDVYYDAFNDPQWVEWHLSQVKKLPARYAAKTMHAFGKEAERGSYQHGAAILDMNGVYSPKTRVEHTAPNGPLTIITPELPRDVLDPSEGI